MDINNKPADSKRYVSLTSRISLTNMLFSLARRICSNVKNENVKEKHLKKLKKTQLQQKYPKLLIEATVLKVSKTPFEVLSQQETTKNEEIVFVTTVYVLNNPTVFHIIKQSFDNFQYSRTMANIFQEKKFVNSMSQAPNLGRLLCRSNFESHHKNDKVKTWKTKTSFLSF